MFNANNDPNIHLNSSWKVSQTNHSNDEGKRASNAPSSSSFDKILSQQDSKQKLARKEKKAADKPEADDEVDDSSEESSSTDESLALGRLQSKQQLSDDAGGDSSADTSPEESSALLAQSTQLPVKDVSIPKESPLALFSHIKSDLKEDSTPKVAKKTESKGSALASIDAEDKKGQGSYTAPNTTISAVTESNEGVGESSKSADLQHLIDQIVDTLTIIETKGQTDTVVKLQHPPLFAGAELRLTAFENAPKEFNISFSNLSPDARQLLLASQNQLLQSLEQKDYVVHILTMTTFVETNPNLSSYDHRQGQRDGRRDQQQGQGQGQGQQQQNQDQR